jgi:hypothetical protein
MSTANCKTCTRRHTAVANGFCEEYSAMPQISHCNAYRQDMTAPVVPSKPVGPTGTYIHIDPSFDQAESRTSA